MIPFEKGKRRFVESLGMPSCALPPTDLLEWAISEGYANEEDGVVNPADLMDNIPWQMADAWEPYEFFARRTEIRLIPTPMKQLKRALLLSGVEMPRAIFIELVDGGLVDEEGYATSLFTEENAPEAFRQWSEEKFTDDVANYRWARTFKARSVLKETVGWTSTPCDDAFAWLVSQGYVSPEGEPIDLLAALDTCPIQAWVDWARMELPQVANLRDVAALHTRVEFRRAAPPGGSEEYEGQVFGRLVDKLSLSLGFMSVEWLAPFVRSLLLDARVIKTVRTSNGMPRQLVDVGGELWVWAGSGDGRFWAVEELRVALIDEWSIRNDIPNFHGEIQAICFA